MFRLQVAVAHTIGHVAATVSMSKVAVSFTHIIKSGEPAFSVLVSRFILGETFPVPVYLSLLPIIGGCALAAVTELNFNMIGNKLVWLFVLECVSRHFATSYSELVLLRLWFYRVFLFCFVFQVLWGLWYQIWHLCSEISFPKRGWRENPLAEWITMPVYLFCPLRFSHPLQSPWKDQQCGLPDGKQLSLKSDPNSYGNYKTNTWFGVIPIIFVINMAVLVFI